jgi:AcrR family transcriptional regulator
MPIKKNPKKPPAAGSRTTKPATKKARGYDSPVRRQQLVETREHILTTGVKLVHKSPSWDWTNLSARAVAESAGLGLRTVQRHFPSERHLRDAVMQRLLEESGLAIENMNLRNFGKFIDQIFGYLSSFTAQPVTPPILDPTLASMDEIRRDSLVTAVAKDTPNLTGADQANIAALLDILWHQPTFERLIGPWNMEPKQAINLLSWAAELVADAVAAGKRPKRIR